MPRPQVRSIPNTSKPPAPLLDTVDAAAYLRLSYDTLCGWRTKGVGPLFVKLGGGTGKRARIRYRIEDLDAFVNAGVRNSTSQQAA